MVGDTYIASSLLFLIIQFIGIFMILGVDFFSFKDILYVFFLSLEICRRGVEDCSGKHYYSRQLEECLLCFRSILLLLYNKIITLYVDFQNKAINCREKNILSFSISTKF